RPPPPPAAPRPPPPPPAPPSPPPPIPLPARPTAPATAPPASPPAMPELRDEDVEPLPLPTAPRDAAPRWRALIAEETVVGRIFLQRLLESLGFEVETAESARELEQLLSRGPWDLALVDVV